MTHVLGGKCVLIYGGATGLGFACAEAMLAALVPMKDRVAYSTSKAGVIGMMRAVALELAEHRVRVNAISPSLVLTELAQEIISREADPAANLGFREAQHPLGRLGKPGDISAAAIYLASPQSDWTTGQNLVVDGGLSIA